MLIQTILGSVAVGSMAGIYKILKNSKDAEDKEVVVENISKYEYIPLEDNENIMFKSFSFKDKIIYQYTEGEKDGLKVCIGLDANGNNVWLDMLNTHLLIGGMARKGKSSLIRSILVGLMLTYTPNEVKFVLCDFKNSDVKLFERYKHIYGGCSHDKVSFLKQMKWLNEECERRALYLAEKDELNMIDYNKNKTIEGKFPYIVVVIDELPQVMADIECQTALHLTMSKVPYTGIYFILATQDCSKNTIGRCKMNCSQTIGFGTRDKTDGDLLMPGAELENIKKAGICKFDDLGEIKEFQSFYTEVQDVKKLLNHNLKD